MPSIRFHVKIRDVPPAAAARILGMTLEAFTAALPELLARKFPSADPTTGNFDTVAMDKWQNRRHPVLFPEDANRGGSELPDERARRMEDLRQRGMENTKRENAELKAKPMTKCERDALQACFAVKGEFVVLESHRRSAVGWLALRGFIETRLDGRYQQSGRITPAGEAEWRRIGEQKLST
jgi:hypothetical protein